MTISCWRAVIGLGYVVPHFSAVAAPQQWGRGESHSQSPFPLTEHPVEKREGKDALHNGGTFSVVCTILTTEEGLWGQNSLVLYYTCLTIIMIHIGAVYYDLSF